MTTPTTSTPPAPARVEFKPAIRQVAAAAGRALSEEQVIALDEDLNGRFFLDPETGAVSVATAAGPVLDAQAAIRAAVAGWPLAEAPAAEPLAAEPEYVTLKLSNSVGLRKASDPMIKIITGFQAAEAARTAAEVKTWPNPWRKGSENRTRQVMIQKFDPARADRFKKDAGL
ncbi:hypothetical protein [Methylobacterium oryzihabitans]|uniref:Uncharacterized protein n=1 Tax=Methylobacterium oryzihabitans TaxID=2499852 RepID=A0A437NR84_9HYPH|nr:hypothetical protein [Methylobacterium oryzihabitans]RVU12504.1 hypothetical protein EOE48_27860 [Methylobacterium oryzihabitans]